MNLRVYTERRNIYIESDEIRTCIKHHIPKRNKYFKEELRRFRAEIREWLMGREVDEIAFVMQPRMTFYHVQLYRAIIAATRTREQLVLLKVELEGEEDITDASAGEHDLIL